MLGTDHRDRVLSADAIELGHHIGTVLDEPNADSSCLPTYLLSGFAREHVTVALSGDGGDEMFGGYGRYFVTVDEWERKRKGDQSLGWWRAGEVYWSSRILVYPDDHLKAALGEIPAELAGRLAEMRRAVEEDRRPLLNVLREADARNYMPGAVLAKVDRMSMQHSLEVRAPLIGIEVADFAKRLAANDCYREGSGKLILKRIASRYLPESWMNRPKRGFGLPMDLWSADKLLPITRALVLGKDCAPARVARPRAPRPLPRRGRARLQLIPGVVALHPRELAEESPGRAGGGGERRRPLARHGRLTRPLRPRRGRSVSTNRPRASGGLHQPQRSRLPLEAESSHTFRHRTCVQIMDRSVRSRLLNGSTNCDRIASVTNGNIVSFGPKNR